MSDHEQTSNNYARCDYCPGRQSTWSVVIDGNGDIERLECKQCGGTGYVPGQEALPK